MFTRIIAGSILYRSLFLTQVFPVALLSGWIHIQHEFHSIAGWQVASHLWIQGLPVCGNDILVGLGEKWFFYIVKLLLQGSMTTELAEMC